MFIEEIVGAFTGQNRRDRRRQVIIGTSLGVLAGLALGVLFAPKSGKETREELAEAANKGLDKAVELAEQGAEYAKQSLEAAREKVQTYAQSVQDQFDEFTHFLPEDLEVCIVEEGEENELEKEVTLELSQEALEKAERAEARQERIANRENA